MRTVSEHEWATVGGLFVAGAYAAQKCRKDGLRPDHFTNRSLGMAYQVLLDLSDTHGAIDRPLFRKGLKQQFADIGESNFELTADEVIAQIFTGQWSAVLVPHHSARVRDYALQCILKDELAAAAAAVDTHDGPVKDIIAEVNRRISALYVQPSQEAGRLRSVVPQVYQGMKDRYERGQKIGGFSTSFPTLDCTIDGLSPGTLHIVAGKTASGKSTLVGNIACHVAFVHKAPGVIFSLEMKREQLVTRYIFSTAKVSREAYKNQTLTPEEWQRLDESAAHLSTLPIVVEDTVSLTLPEICGYLRQMRFNNECDWAVVDYTQLVQTGSKRKETRETEVSEIVRDLRNLSMELSIPIIALSQLNDDGRTRESRSLENYAESLLVVECKEDRKDPIVREKEAISYDLIVQKNRDGEVRTIPLMFFPRHTRFMEETYGDY